MPDPLVTAGVLGEVLAERERQDSRWSEQNHPDGTDAQHLGPIEVFDLVKHELGKLASYTPMHAKQIARNVATSITEAHALSGCLTWTDILLEEVLEALAEREPGTLRAELVQVAAVAVAWIEAIDRRTPRIYTSDGTEITFDQAAILMTRHMRDPRVDPQPGDVVTLPPRQGFQSVPVCVVQRRGECIFFATGTCGIRAIWLRDWHVQCVSARVIEDIDKAWPLPAPASEVASG